jgi:hypothetical protein
MFGKIFKFGYIGHIIFLAGLGALLLGKYYIFGDVTTPLCGLYNLGCAVVGMIGIALMFIKRKTNKNKWI